MKVFLYIRVSHKNSADSGISPEAQTQQGVKYAESIAPGAEIVIHSDEGVSGWSKSFASRYGGKQIYDQCQEGDHVICYSICRLARNLRDFCNVRYQLEKRGVHLHFVENQINTATATGKLQLSILAALAQFSSDLTSERTREALLIKRIREGKAPSRGSRNTPRRHAVASEFIEKQKGPPTIRMPGRVHRYERVSRDRQYISGLGLEHQTKSNLASAERIASETGGTVGNNYSDPAISAYSIPFAKRPAGKQLLEDLQPGDDVVFYRMDRGFRNTADAIATIDLITQKGAYVHFVCEGIRTDADTGKDWVNLLASVAELESRMKSRRILAIFDQCRATGRPISRARQGLRIENISSRQKRLAIDKKEALRLAICWVLKNEYQLNKKQVLDALIAIKARSSNRDARLDMVKRNNATRQLEQATKFKEIAGASLWNKYLEKAREEIRKPFTPGQLRLLRWEHPFNTEEHPRLVAC